MIKKNNKYRITLEEIALKNESEFPNEPLTVEFDNHDDIFKIIRSIKGKKMFETDNQAVEFAIGLKMFSEVMLKNRNHELFTDFRPAFGEFMKKLKSQPQQP